jgi:hypothetical protein
MSCEVIAAQGVAERYLLGQLNEPEQEAFERHYFGCDRCFDELKTLEAMRAELSGTAATSAARATRQAWWPVWLGAATAGVLIAAIGFWMMRPNRETRLTPGPGAARPVASSPPAVAAPPAPPLTTPPVSTPAVSIAELARFDPPTYTPPVLRGPEDDARRAFREAMTLYGRGDHRGAIAGLRKSASLDPSAADASFFLGVSQLLAGQPKEGVAELRRTVALGASPYLEEAYLYLAKGSLQLRDVDGGRRALRSMIALGGDRQREAKELLTQIDRVGSNRQ